MLRLECSDFGEFAEALSGVDGRYLRMGTSQQQWRLEVVELDGVTVMLGQDGAANLFQASCQAGVHSLFVPLSPDGSVSVGGEFLERHHVSWLEPGAEFHMHATTALCWLAVMVSVPVSWPDALTHPHTTRAAPSCIDRLIALSRSALALDRDMTPAGRVVLRGHLLQATRNVVESMHTMEPRRGRPTTPRQTIIADALERIEHSLGRAVLTSELCEAAGVSARTLQSAFHDYFGVSPHRYVMMRRLHAIHDALLAASPHETVSDICGRFGVWDFGRFARTYQAHFGRPPSHVLTIRRKGSVM